MKLTSYIRTTLAIWLSLSVAGLAFADRKVDRWKKPTSGTARASIGYQKKSKPADARIKPEPRYRRTTGSKYRRTTGSRYRRTTGRRYRRTTGRRYSGRRYAERRRFSSGRTYRRSYRRPYRRSAHRRRNAAIAAGVGAAAIGAIALGAAVAHAQTPQRRVIVHEPIAAEPQLWACSVEGAFGQTFHGKGKVRKVAIFDARSRCEKFYHSMHCDALADCQLI